MKRILFAIALLAWTAAAPAGTFKTIERELDALKGQPLSAAADKLGIPSGKMEMGNETIYSWDANVAAYDSGQLTCSIKVSVGPDNVIKRTNYLGNSGACAIYAKRLAAPH